MKVGKRRAECFENDRCSIARQSRGRSEIYGLMMKGSSNHSRLNMAWGPNPGQPNAGWTPCQMRSPVLLNVRFMWRSASDRSLIFKATRQGRFPIRRLSPNDEAGGSCKGDNEDSNQVSQR